MLIMECTVDLLKTRMQQGDGTLKTQCVSFTSAKKTPLTEHPSRSALIFGTTRDVIAQNGLAGLWRGTAASLIR